MYVGVGVGITHNDPLRVSLLHDGTVAVGVGTVVGVSPEACVGNTSSIVEDIPKVENAVNTIAQAATKSAA